MGGVRLEDRLIVALDVPSEEQARDAVGRLNGVATFYKVGLQLQAMIGPEFIRWLLQCGAKVFLDYKYLDVDETVRQAVARAADLGVTFVTVHAQGAAMRAAVEGRGSSGLRLLAVTVLTSLDGADLQEMGFRPRVEDLVLSRARRALDAGCDGVIASGQEAGLIRGDVGNRLVIVTPGIRPTGTNRDEQKRAATPAEAIAAGADHLVVGRPILRAADPAEAARRILDEIGAAVARRGA
jgi:orotidine-5'-phosphate decarboxylase